MTLQERYIRFLEARGFAIIEHRTQKYTVLKGRFLNDNKDSVRFFYLGKHGAVRMDRKGNITDSAVITVLKSAMERWEKQKELST